MGSAKKVRLAVVGPQGSGKGTQARLLSKKLGIPHVSMGQLLRDEVKRGSPLGKEIARYINNGNLAPESITDQIIANLLERYESFILDGYPRTRHQAELLASLTVLDALILIDISDGVAVERIASRRVCPVCHREYNLKFAPPKTEGVCDDDGAALVQRDDDKPEAIRRRLEIYHKDSEEVLGVFKSILIKINGEQPIERVHEDILRALHFQE
ncbi:nucleoside monophosphate kinase [Candidatus Woesearchaeota archaeon]|nr:MAG: nucleoside monophosphate kinase [Candidatus Woesearchaeota archaeon]